MFRLKSALTVAVLALTAVAASSGAPAVADVTSAVQPPSTGNIHCC